MEIESPKTPDFRNSKYIRELRQKCIQHFSLEELRVIAFDLGVDWSSLPGETKNIKLLELIEYLNRRKELGQLSKQLRRERPNVNWPGYPEGTRLRLSYRYQGYGETSDGEPISNEGEGEASLEIDGDTYFDDGLALSQVMGSVADHIYTFEVEKKGHSGFSEITISISELNWEIIDIPDSK